MIKNVNINKDSVNAFTERIEFSTKEKVGPLRQYQFAVKDVFAIKGFRIQAGNPEYYRTAKVAKCTARSIEILTRAGATLMGKTQTDELGGSLFGLNEHYGPPLNSCSPACVPGGSSSGSAAAVAAGLVDFALGADTSGSVRAPASFCGVYGLRPTLGRISTAGILPISAHLDTVGIFSQTPHILAHVLDVYGMNERTAFRRIRLISSLVDHLKADLKSKFLEKINILKEFISLEKPLLLEKEQLEEWRSIIRTIAMYGLWQTHKEWILKSNPHFGELIRDRLKMAQSVSYEDYKIALKKQQIVKEIMEEVLEPGDLAIFPTVHDTPPLLSSSLSFLKDFALKAACHTCISALSGLPEIVIPLRHINEKGSLGMSCLGRPRDDYSLTLFASKIHFLLTQKYKG